MSEPGVSFPRSKPDRRTTFPRWLVPPAALAVHLCIGQAYATSVYKTALVKPFGASLTEIGVIFSIAIVMLGLSAAIMGTWVDKNGPRKAMFTSAMFWASGFLIGSLGIFTNQLWLVYLGYGFVGGALIASPVSTALLKMYAPDSGATGWVASGDAVGRLFLTLAVVYLVYMLFGAFTIKVPAEGWQPEGFDPAKVKAATLAGDGTTILEHGQYFTLPLRQPATAATTNSTTSFTASSSSNA